MLAGYMRVPSNGDRQAIDLQRDGSSPPASALRHLFEDKASGARQDRAGLKAALDKL